MTTIVRYRTVCAPNGHTHETYHDAQAPFDAAMSASRAWYSDCSVDADGDGCDLYGSYWRFVARHSQSRRSLAIRVYKPDGAR